MDCASCALKIERALERMPGISGVNISYPSGMLSLQYDKDRIAPGIIESRVGALGYTLVAQDQELEKSAPRNSERQAWWRGFNARLVFGIGALFAVAFLIAQVWPQLSQWAFSAAAFVSVIPFARRAVVGATSGSPFSIESLMTIAALGAVAIGKAEEAAVVIFLFAVGELLETIAAVHARAGIESLIDLIPRTARLLRDNSSEAVEVPVEDLIVGDLVVVRPGDRVPSDGKVIEGSSEVDEAPVTGEFVPALKEAGAAVFAGSINFSGELRVEITRVAADNTIARIVHLVEEAQDSKAPIARMIDRFSRWYTPAAMGLALLVVLVPPIAFGGDWMTWIYRGLATLLVACPCALVISTPAAIASGLAAGAREGLLIKGGAALETLGNVKMVAFDKTGTLTKGRPQVTDIVPLAGDENAVLALAAAIERNASHPIGLAIVDAARKRGLVLPATFGGSSAIPGKAVTARVKGGFASVGSPRFAAEQVSLDEKASEAIARLEREGKTVVVLLSGKSNEGLIALRDEPREDAIEGVKRLRKQGIATIMLTGDNARTASAIAAQLGLQARAELLPEAKLAEIAELRRGGSIAMVGDGINDAPALAAASVGVAMGGGTDVALETADAALLKNRVTGVSELIDLSRATLRNIKQNITIALGLKAVFLVTTLFGFTTLWMAILADTGATVLVTANALRLLTHRFK